MTKKIRAALLVSACCAVTPAFADIDIRGFASVGVGYLDSDELDSVDGIEGEFSSAPFNRLGLQIKADMNERTSVTGQLLATGEGDYSVEAEWLYVNFKATDSLDVRIGKLRGPYFYYSDYLDVGYAYPWITPPRETYRLPFSAVEGIDVVYNHSLLGGDSVLQLHYGVINSEFAGTSVSVKDTFGVNYTWANDWLTLRASVNKGNVKIGSAPTEAGIFSGFGINVDRNNFLLNMEYTMITMDDHLLIPDDAGYHVMFGYRMGDFTPHFTYSAQENDELNTINPSSGMPITFNEFVDSSTTLGLRYDISPGTALKIEGSNVTREEAGFVGLVPNTESDGMLYSISVDTVF